MDSPSTTPNSTEEIPRVKFLCSFAGSILPRPQDGKLRYVGGETRIVCLPRDISFEELIGKMRELYEGVTVLKYQQPDEDLDALVSVVNDDDVTNMMEEYDKLGSGDGFTRLRIFLFPQPDQDVSSHFVDGDERDTERRYVDALNSLNESPDYRKQLSSDVDDIHAAEQYFNQMSLDGGLHNQRNYDMHIPQFNLHHLNIPHVGSGQLQQMEAPWSPAYYSPRPLPDYPSSPSSARYPNPYGEFTEKGPEQTIHQSPYDQQQVSDGVVWLPAGSGPGDKSCFPGNILQAPSGFDGSSICEHCRMSFQRGPAYTESPWKHGEPPQLEQPNTANGFHQVASHCAECFPNREAFMLSNGFYPREHNSVFNETNSHGRGWMQQLQSPRLDDSRSHIPVAGRLNEHYIVDNTAMNVPPVPGNLSESHHMPPNYVHQEEVPHPRFVRSATEVGHEVLHDQALTTGSHMYGVPSVDERGPRYANSPFAYGADNVYHVAHGQTPGHSGHALWRNVHQPLHGTPSSYEVSAPPPQVNGTATGFVRAAQDSSPRLRMGGQNQNPWVESSQTNVGFDGTPVSVSCYGHTSNSIPHAYPQEIQHPVRVDAIPSPAVLDLTPTTPVPLADPPLVMTNNGLVSLNMPSGELRMDSTTVTGSSGMEEISTRATEAYQSNMAQQANLLNLSLPQKNDNPEVAYTVSICSSGLRPAPEGISTPSENGTHAALEDKELSDRLSCLPELITSIKKPSLEAAGAIQTDVEENASPSSVAGATAKEEARNEMELADAHGDLEDYDNEHPNDSKIEPTKAEAEAIAKGLQTIKNDDLEEIRELGSGTYGAVFYGKWKGSDVAIKRIKASCFAGRPSDRERLIADFWKEALILSSLHHPNVVSFYGIVRDGPDGSLATVTEYMVNGSLKQFLQKKDRTIDRRKRLIIAMDAAFGMEYLHGKNIVHFDLKCENLLVNMRDPHRPVCKIGDLGLSKVKQHTLVSGGVRGTLPWMAPELLSGKSNMVTEKIDVYSFGIVMWELLTGDEPYTDMHCASIIGGIVNNTLRPKIPTWCDPEWKSLMESCWASEPGERPSFSDISQKLRNMAAAMNLK